MDKNNNRLFIHKDMEYVSLEHNVEIILTPQFYTLIREELDIKFAYQAKQIANSLFDDFIDSSKEHQYYVNKCNNEWCFYAYNIEEIENFLTNKGIEVNRVSKIYFAQELNKLLEEPIALDEKNILQTIDGIVTLFPKQLLDENVSLKSIDLSQIKLKSGVSIGASHNSFIPVKETILLSSIFSILGVLFIIEGTRIKSSINNDNEHLIQLIDDNPKYGSKILRTNMLEKYQPIDTNERIKRQSIQDISKLLSANSQLTTLSIEKSTITANIKTSNKNTAARVLQNAKAKNFTSSANNLEIKVEKKI